MAEYEDKNASVAGHVGAEGSVRDLATTLDKAISDAIRPDIDDLVSRSFLSRAQKRVANGRLWLKDVCARAAELLMSPLDDMHILPREVVLARFEDGDTGKVEEQQGYRCQKCNFKDEAQETHDRG